MNALERYINELVERDRVGCSHGVPVLCGGQLNSCDGVYLIISMPHGYDLFDLIRDNLH